MKEDLKIVEREDTYRGCNRFVEKIEEAFEKGYRLKRDGSYSSQVHLRPYSVVLKFVGLPHPAYLFKSYNELKTYANSIGSKIDFKKYKSPISIQKYLEEEFKHNPETGLLLIDEEKISKKT